MIKGRIAGGKNYSATSSGKLQFMIEKKTTSTQPNILA